MPIAPLCQRETQASLTSGFMGTVLLVLVAMTAVGTAAGVTITAPWLVGWDPQQPQQQQQVMINIIMNNRGIAETIVGICFWIVVWGFFSVFSIFCASSNGD